MQNIDILLTSREVLRITGYRSKTTLWRKVRRQTFPPPVRLGFQTIRWRTSEIEAWLEDLPSGFAVQPTNLEKS